MEPQFWHARWTAGQIGFHQAEINRHLRDLWPKLELASNAPVLVPLCGKSMDMVWLHDLGHPVVGVELSALACAAFFVEQQLTFHVEQLDNAEVFHGEGIARGITLWCADFFALGANDIGPIGGLYDRAALIALPEPLRRKYAQHLASLVPKPARGLLVTLDYPQVERAGPPFSVPEVEVHALFDEAFAVEQWRREDMLAQPDAAEQSWGVTALHQTAYALTRR